jgi:hypothetical protein
MSTTETLRPYLVSVTRTLTYRVQATDADHALDVYAEEDPEEISGETERMHAESEDDDEIDEATRTP